MTHLVLGSVFKTDGIGRYRYPLNTLHFNAINATLVFSKNWRPLIANTQKAVVQNSNLTRNVTM